MAACPYCSREAAAGVRVCGTCGRALIQRCLACAEDIPVRSAVCPLCRSPQSDGPAKAPRPVTRWTGDERNILVMLILWFVTCGVWGLVAFYQVGSDLNDHGRRRLNPGLDIVLGVLTCGLWFIYAVYCYSEALKEITHGHGGPVRDVTTVATLVECLRYFGVPGIVSTMILQSELNQHGRTLRGA